MRPVAADNPLILASSSAARASLLARIGVPFEVDAPGLDETPGPDETPAGLAQRLARAKAQAVAARHPGRWVLGSDQVPSLEGRPLQKPGTRANARAQLRAFSGKSLVFHTAVALLGDGTARTAFDTTRVHFRSLDADEIERYLDAEPAFDSAGSFRVEGLGITLFSAIETRDPSALVGLPLIEVRRLLAAAGYRVP